jgi:UDP-2,3-diacylglucosamine hydrolase
MLLFLSDLHLGRGAPAESRAAERDAVALLAAHAPDLAGRGGGLLLLGDVFNAWMEYRTLVPKGFVRFQGALAELADGGVPVTYVVGNRDPWHLGYFEEEIGARVVDGPLLREAYGRRVIAAHGDGRIAAERRANRLRPVLRSGLAYRLFRNGLPGDWGFRLARAVAGRGSGAPEPRVVDGLREEARRLLRETPADLAVLGHSHRAELSDLPEGTFLNPGYWFAERTFGVFDAAGPRLLRWSEGAAVPLAAPARPSDAFRRSSTGTPPTLRNNPPPATVSGPTLSPPR